MTTNPSWTLSPAAQAAQWSQQYGTGSAPGATNPSWEIARKALEKLGDSSSGEAGSSGEGSGKESKSSPEKKKKGDGESEGGKTKDPTPQEAPDFMSQQHQMNMYGNYYGQPYGGGGGMYPYSGYGPGYGMPPPHHMRGGPYHGYPGPPGGMYPPYGPRPPYGDHRGPGFPPQHPRGPMAQRPPPPPPTPPHSLLGRPDPSPQPPLPPPSSKSSSANPSQQSQAQVSGDSDGGGGGGGRGGDGHGFTPAMKFRQEAQQLHTGSRWNKNFNQPSDTPGVRFSLPNKRSGMHPSPMTDGPRGQGQQANQFNNNKKKGGKQDSAGSQQPKKHTSAVSPADWPPSLKDYVQRAFNSCQNEAEKDKVESHLKKILTEAHSQGTVMTKDWSQEPLPLSPHATPSPSSPHDKPDAPWSASRNQDPNPPRYGSDNYVDVTRQGVGRGRGRGRGQWNKNQENQPGRYPNRVAEPAKGRHGRKIFGFSRDYSSGSDSSYSRSRSRSRSRSWSRSRSRSRSRSPRSRRRSRRYRDDRDRSPRSHDRDYLPLSSERKEKGKGRSRGRGRGRGRGRKNEDAEIDRRNERTPGKKGQKGKNKNVGNVNYVDEKERTMRMQKRAARFQDMLGEDDSPSVGSGGKKQRTQKLSLQINEVLTGEGDDVEWSMEPIVGTSQEEWKQYLRLTSAPDPSQVRPINVLRKSLVKVKERWKDTQDYRFVCEQLKSIRQDLTIQCIRNEFSVEVYETHGRIALEKGDVPEFNQCQTQLKALYSEGIPGNVHEFQAYHILYYICMENTMEMNTALATLRPESREDPMVKHALALRSAWAMTDYHKFFKLYRTAPRMGPYVIDMFLARERKNAIKIIVKSFRPMVSVEYVANSLAFNNNEECITFLTELNVVLNADRTKVDCKQSMAAMAAAEAS